MGVVARTMRKIRATGRLDAQDSFGLHEFGVADCEKMALLRMGGYHAAMVQLVK